MANQAKEITQNENIEEIKAEILISPILTIFELFF